MVSKFAPFAIALANVKSGARPSVAEQVVSRSPGSGYAVVADIVFVPTSSRSPACIDGFFHFVACLVPGVDRRLLARLRPERVLSANHLYIVDLSVTVGALVFGWLLSTDAFSPLFITRVRRIASLLATKMGLRTPHWLIEQKVREKTVDLEAQQAQLNGENARLRQKLTQAQLGTAPPTSIRIRRCCIKMKSGNHGGSNQSVDAAQPLVAAGRPVEGKPPMVEGLSLSHCTTNLNVFCFRCYCVCFHSHGLSFAHLDQHPSPQGADQLSQTGHFQWQQQMTKAQLWYLGTVVVTASYGFRQATSRFRLSFVCACVNILLDFAHLVGQTAKQLQCIGSLCSVYAWSGLLTIRLRNRRQGERFGTCPILPSLAPLFLARIASTT